MSRKINPSGYGAYLILKPWFLKFFYWEQSRPVTHRDLKPVIVDSKGRNYYEYPEGMALPMERSARITEYMQWISSGLDNVNLKKLCEAIEFHQTQAMKLVEKPKAFAKEMAQATAILREVGERNERVVPLDLIINTLCAQLVREDEDPAGWNQSIHEEKCNFFKENQSSYQFFFRFTAFRKLSQTLNVSNGNWIQYLVRATQELQIIQEIISSSEKQSLQGEKS